MPACAEARHHSLRLEEGHQRTWKAGEDDRFGEPVFVPRHDKAEEGDGWVLATIFRAAEGRSDLAFSRATDIAKGPVALAHLSSRCRRASMATGVRYAVG